MIDPRNPFLKRTAEQIESEDTFLRLFGPGVLDLLSNDNLWDRVQMFQSAPGGGKTSLFRVFTPSALLALYETRSSQDYQELLKRMRELGVVSDSGPNLLGVYLSCARNYALLDDLDYDPSRKIRLLYSLLNARLILVALRGALTLRGLHYPGDLSRLRITAPKNGDFPTWVPLPCSGNDLFQWAQSVEKMVCATIDSFGPSPHDPVEGHDTLYALSLIRPEHILVDDQPVANRVIIMLDDFHKLGVSQRRQLLSTIFDLKAPVGVWIAERLEALSAPELLTVGSITGREYGEPIRLEDYWGEANSKRFENAVINIADRRVRSARDVHASSYSGFLRESLDGTKWEGRFSTASDTVATRVKNRWGSKEKYRDWVQAAEDYRGPASERAVAWRQLEILIERDIRKAQLSFDFALPTEQLEARESSNTRAVAEFFISQEFDIPYYFGMSRLVTLASANIEQFLAFAGEMFEEVAAASVLKRRTTLTPDRQESIMKRLANQRWQEIPRRVQAGRLSQKLLEAMTSYARWETYRPNAPYAPGVTGIGLSIGDRDKLIDPSVRRKSSEYDQLASVLSACISNKLLEVLFGVNQGEKGKTWIVLYLNRWLCLHFGLPLHYGGWRPKAPDELCRWLDRGFRASSRDEERLV
jgi:hypothetical protein